MIQSPSKYCAIDFLKYLQANNYIAASGQEYCKQEVDHLLNHKLSTRQHFTDEEMNLFYAKPGTDFYTDLYQQWEDRHNDCRTTTHQDRELRKRISDENKRSAASTSPRAHYRKLSRRNERNQTRQVRVEHSNHQKENERIFRASAAPNRSAQQRGRMVSEEQTHRQEHAFSRRNNFSPKGIGLLLLDRLERRIMEEFKHDLWTYNAGSAPDRTGSIDRPPNHSENNWHTQNDYNRSMGQG